MGRVQEQPAVGMLSADIFHASDTLSQCHVAILDDGGGATRMKGFVLRGSKDRTPFICFELVCKTQFFAEPGNSLRLRDIEVVDDEDHDDWCCFVKRQIERQYLVSCIDLGTGGLSLQLVYEVN